MRTTYEVVLLTSRDNFENTRLHHCAHFIGGPAQEGPKVQICPRGVDDGAALSIVRDGVFRHVHHLGGPVEGPSERRGSRETLYGTRNRNLLLFTSSILPLLTAGTQGRVWKRGIQAQCENMGFKFH